ncbi:ribokinase [Sporosarcina sp. NPDC096371]|uniref:ribokinase n=1 Tax=Sporosarcina sp. NPDC096371 TaxID=3364530 RepID=UPI00382A34EF
MGKITVVGSMSTDFVVSTSRKPEKGETIIGESFEMTFGGKGANQAVAISRLGGHSELVGHIGSDIFGKGILTNLEDNGVGVSDINIAQGIPSGSAHIILSEQDNSIIVVEGANACTNKDWIEKNVGNIIDSEAVLIQHEIPKEAVETLINICFEHQVLCVLNPAPAREVSRSVLRKVKYLTPNEHEVEALFPNVSLEEALESMPNQLLVTLGERGVVFHNGKQVVQVKAYEATLIDTTGAGDTFSGAFTLAITKGNSLLDSIKIGNLCAALSIQKFGAQGGIPLLDNLKKDPRFEAHWKL